MRIRKGNRIRQVKTCRVGFHPPFTKRRLSPSRLFLVGSSQEKALIISDPTDEGQLIAVNPICSHAGCTVAWDSEKQLFICPCHDSQFSSDGQVAGGPATKALASYEVKLEGDAILVKTS
ncbi:MAG: ubiquinol-cytochrome c reductase iron-sulfur subunit [Crocosphaera sp.]|nr:ubiquinol-cytochrome c reductase iron-sulfur subunit [Crocosphaera sp.]